MYEKLTTGEIRRTTDGGVFWPNDDSNPSSVAYDDWVAQGNTSPNASAAIVPAKVTPLQARRALRAAGLLGTVNAWVAQQDDEDIKDAWDYALVIERNGPITVGAAAALGLTAAQLDTLFIAAAAL